MGKEKKVHWKLSYQTFSQHADNNEFLNGEDETRNMLGYSGTGMRRKRRLLKRQ